MDDDNGASFAGGRNGQKEASQVGSYFSEKPKAVFQKIYRTNHWQGTESISGPGSSLKATALVREHLSALFLDLQIRTLSDAPCGDAKWISQITGPLDSYVGYDIVPELIQENLERRTSANQFFHEANIIVDVLPKTDAILCRDCLVHLPFDAAHEAIKNFVKSHSTYLVATTFPATAANLDSGYGGWRRLNLETAPFNFPEPIRLINERDGGGKHGDKALGVWRLSELSVGSRY